MSLTELQELFKDDRFATGAGCRIVEANEEKTVCELEITDNHLNARGGVMGGAIFTLADFAFAVASNWENMGCVSLRSDISFLSGAKGERLIAKAECIKDGRTTACYRVDVTDDLGNLAATVTVTGYHTR